uniref:DUF4748 domain-containing protein n=1 Tax=Scatophagus argus TaxID=75038 RepID=UPI001ED7ECBC|nr:DUF4748 domain-containing protein [Scatophagus argus]
MAAPCVIAVRTALKGVNLFPSRWLLTLRRQSPAVCQRLRLHVSPASSLCSSRTEPQRSSQPHTTAATRTDSKSAGEEEEEEELEGPEYIPKRKAKNPMIKIGYAWMLGLPIGIISFLLAKRQVDKNRLKQRKIRQRMRKSNEGQYDGSRYHHPAEDVKMD